MPVYVGFALNMNPDLIIRSKTALLDDMLDLPHIIQYVLEEGAGKIFAATISQVGA